MNDVACMERALTLAARGLYTTLPNPRVGCVIVKDGEIVGEGWHEYAGGKHAEVVALAQAGRRAHGADVYVTLEPCNHWGRTPPCCEALVRAKVARVFVATPDPVAHTNQQGTEALRQHGIQVFHGLLAAQARALNPGFFTRVAKQRPWIRIKSAITMDGRTAFEADAGCWISSVASRRDVQFWRARSDVLLTGFGTVRTDDPRLNVRIDAASLKISGAVRQPLRVVVDSRLQTDPGARIYRQSGSAVVATCRGASAAIEAFAASGVDVWQFAPQDRRIPLMELFARLAREGFCEVQVEAGAGLVGALLAAGLCDEMLLYIAPNIFGQGMPLARIEHTHAMPQGYGFRWQQITRLDDDLRILLHRKDA